MKTYLYSESIKYYVHALKIKSHPNHSVYVVVYVLFSKLYIYNMLVILLSIVGKNMLCHGLHIHCLRLFLIFTRIDV